MISAGAQGVLSSGGVLDKYGRCPFTPAVNMEGGSRLDQDDFASEMRIYSTPVYGINSTVPAALVAEIHWYYTFSCWSCGDHVGSKDIHVWTHMLG